MDKGRLLNLARRFKRVYESGKPYMPDSSWTLTQHQEQHKHRVERAQRLLSLEHIPRLTEAELCELFADTDALGFFRDKGKRDKELDKLLSGEGTERIRSVLLSLFQKAEAELTPDAFSEAQQPTGVGPLLISELLSYRFPSRYYTYSPKATLDALKILGKDVRAAQPHGKKGDHYLYIVIRPLMGEICNALRKVGLTEVDYMLADIFVHWVYEVKPPNDELPPPEDGLTQYFASQGLRFTSEQLATFYTALKTKGFVILTGISGTGKTKLAQYFAELLGSKDQFHFAAVRPDWRDSKSLLGYFNPLLGEEGQFQSTEFLGFILEATEQYRGSGGSKREDLLALVEKLVEFDSPLTRADLPEEARELVQRQPGIQKISRETFAKILDLGAAADRFDLSRVTQTFLLRLHEVSPYADEPRKQYHFRMGIPGSRQLSDPLSKGEKVAFVYYSPDRSLWAAGTFDRMERRESGASPHVPYFVLLDEMNLAKVEYYFADFLSVLESGRRQDGFTKEAIRFQCPKGIDGPPPKLRLPPNLYFIGTVNVDETTYMFSPKVLDRAFTLELSEVDFAAYPSERGDGLSQEELEALRAQLLPDFTNQGRFAIVDKNAVADFVRQYPTHREHLKELNVLLRSHDLHFGYRVFDEIMMFLANAEGSPVFDGFGPGGLDAAFDAAVLMKVLPKFHGTRGKLREPLEKIVEWAREPDNPEAGRQALADGLQDTKRITSLKEDLRKRIEGGAIEESSDANAFAYPRTALKALRMLHDLHTTGFASFA